MILYDAKDVAPWHSTTPEEGSIFSILFIEDLDVKVFIKKAKLQKKMRGGIWNMSAGDFYLDIPVGLNCGKRKKYYLCS